MTQIPKASLKPNSSAFENEPLIKPTGFRAYDARWWFGHPASDVAPALNLYGIPALGLCPQPFGLLSLQFPWL